MREGFIQKYGLEDFVESHKKVEDYSFVKELNSKYSEFESDSKNLKGETKKLSKDFEKVNENLDNCYPVEKEIYEREFSKIERELKQTKSKLEKSLAEKAEVSSKKLIETSYLHDYPSILDTSIFDRKIDYTTNVDSRFGFKSNNIDIYVKPEEKSYSSKFTLDLPEFAVYSLFDSVCKLVVEGKTNFLTDSKKRLDNVKLKGSNVPFFKNLKFDNKFVDSGDFNYQCHTEIESRFFGVISNFKKEIEDAKSIFGEKNIYVLAKANWTNRFGSIPSKRKEDDFIIFAKNESTDRLHLVAESEK